MKNEPLDPNMIIFLQDHPMARAVVYSMMKNAATTGDDPKMIVWLEKKKINDNSSKI